MSGSLDLGRYAKRYRCATPVLYRSSQTGLGHIFTTFPGSALCFFPRLRGLLLYRMTVEPYAYLVLQQYLASWLLIVPTVTLVRPSVPGFPVLVVCTSHGSSQQLKVFRTAMWFTVEVLIVRS